MKCGICVISFVERSEGKGAECSIFILKRGNLVMLQLQKLSIVTVLKMDILNKEGGGGYGLFLD